MGDSISRPTVSLCCILKDELKNLPRFLESVKGCFDEIHLTDTGSTDGSVAYIESLMGRPNPADSKISLHHFAWVDDFAEARNFSFSHAKTDFLMWMDLDDVMNGREEFIKWRDTIMKIGDFWAATYNYQLNEQGKPVCSFARERVIRNGLNLKWKYFVHEGIPPVSDVKKVVDCMYATSWSINHVRDQEDIKKDKSRNLRLCEQRVDTLDARMLYYYGKELFENGKPREAYPHLKKAIGEEKLEGHDRVMGVQYACMAALLCEEWDTAILLAHQGLALDPNRAEFFVIIGDAYLKKSAWLQAVPYYEAATKCPYRGEAKIQGALYAHEDSYKHYPVNQMARVYANVGDMDKAEAMAKRGLDLGENPESRGILNDVLKIKEAAGVTITTPRPKSEDLVIAGVPQGFYEWDEEIYEKMGIGGSETAVVEMSRWISRLTKRRVLVFNNREFPKSFDNVHYLPAKDLPNYYKEHEPKVTINWRHNIKVSDSPTYIWCHDLSVQNIENAYYEKVIALSNFHRDFIHTLFGVPLDKIWVSRNGVNPDRFLESQEKVPGRVIFSSSPDRGLIRAMKVMDQVVKEIPGAELHAFYGVDNMLKAGRKAEADEIMVEVAKRPFVKFHGNVSQKELTKQMGQAEVWLYPTCFLETFCITAIEAVCSKTFPVVREWGALPDTLKSYRDLSQAAVIDSDCELEAEVNKYASVVVDAMRSRKWETIDSSPDRHSWESVAKEWIDFMGL